MTNFSTIGLLLGRIVGVMLGCIVGEDDGFLEGLSVGVTDELFVIEVGDRDGGVESNVGFLVGFVEALSFCPTIGLIVGGSVVMVGLFEGVLVGFDVSDVGETVGVKVGGNDGSFVGVMVGMAVGDNVVGDIDGLEDGFNVGFSDGDSVGSG